MVTAHRESDSVHQGKHKRTPNDGRGVGLTLCYRVQLYHEYPYPGPPSLLGVSRVEYTLTYLTSSYIIILLCTLNIMYTIVRYSSSSTRTAGILRSYVRRERQTQEETLQYYELARRVVVLLRDFPLSDHNEVLQRFRR